MFSDFVRVLRETRGWGQREAAEQYLEWLAGPPPGLTVLGTIDQSKLSRIESGRIGARDRWLIEATASIFGLSDHVEILRRLFEEQLRTKDEGSLRAMLFDDEYSKQLEARLDDNGYEVDAWLFDAEAAPVLFSPRVQAVWWQNIRKGVTYTLTWIPDASTARTAHELGDLVIPNIERKELGDAVCLRHYLLPPGLSAASKEEHKKLRDELEEQHAAHPSQVEFFAVGANLQDINSSAADDLGTELRVECLKLSSPIGQTVLFEPRGYGRAFASFVIVAAVPELDSEARQRTFHWLDHVATHRMSALVRQIVDHAAKIKSSTLSSSVDEVTST